MSLFSKKKDKDKKQEMYDRVMALHEEADFLCYINEAYKELYQEENCAKLEGCVAMGVGHVQDEYELYSCSGRKKANVTMLELYVGNNKVEQLEGGDKVVALYPKEQELDYKAGDILIIRKKR